MMKSTYSIGLLLIYIIINILLTSIPNVHPEELPVDIITIKPELSVEIDKIIPNHYLVNSTNFEKSLSHFLKSIKGNELTNKTLGDIGPDIGHANKRLNRFFIDFNFILQASVGLQSAACGIGGLMVGLLTKSYDCPTPCQCPSKKLASKSHDRCKTHCFCHYNQKWCPNGNCPLVPVRNTGKCISYPTCPEYCRLTLHPQATQKPSKKPSTTRKPKPKPPSTTTTKFPYPPTEDPDDSDEPDSPVNPPSKGTKSYNVKRDVMSDSFSIVKKRSLSSSIMDEEEIDNGEYLGLYYYDRFLNDLPFNESIRDRVDKLIDEALPDLVDHLLYRDMIQVLDAFHEKIPNNRFGSSSNSSLAIDRGQVVKAAKSIIGQIAHFRTELNCPCPKDRCDEVYDTGSCDYTCPNLPGCLLGRCICPVPQ